MTSREKMAVSVAPFFLRIALSVTFIWAGLGKIIAEMPVSGESAAILANMGVSGLQSRAGSSSVSSSSSPPAAIAPEQAAATAKPETQRPTPAINDPVKKDAIKESKPSGPPSGPPALVQALAMQSGPSAANTFTAADFPQPVNVARVYGIALMLHKGAQTTTADGKAVSFPLVPAMLADGAKPRWLAWTASITEVIAGLLVLFGLFTRLAALALAGTIAVAIWLTQIGPAIQSGNATLGFLPNNPAFDVAAWQTPLWQLCILCAAISLFFAGPGGLSMDRIISGRPVVSKNKPAPAPK